VFVALGSSGLAPEMPTISFADARGDRDADRRLRVVETAVERGDARARDAAEQDFDALVAGSREGAFRLLERYEAGEFDDTDAEGVVLKSLVLSGDEAVSERAMDAGRRREIERHAPRRPENVLDSLEGAIEPSEIETIAPEDLEDSRLRFEIECLAEGGATNDLRAAAIRALARARDASVTDFLLRRLEWETAVEVRQAIALGLMLRHEPAAGERLALLLATLSEADAVRLCAAQGLSGHSSLPSSRSALLDAFGRCESDGRLRAAIVGGLGSIPSDPEVEDALIAALASDPSEAVRAAAAQSLMASPTARACDALRQAIATTDSGLVRAHAEQTLAFLQESMAAAQHLGSTAASPSAPVPPR
jgi:HEAT repeat protein